MKVNPYDFTGYATKYDILCGDGRTIRRGAFKEADGARVSLVWDHRRKDPTNILGYADLEHRDDGVYCRASFNDTPKAKQVLACLKHGDLNGLSIYANHLIEKAGDVFKGKIQEVSLVTSKANPGAMIDTVLEHSDNPNYEFDDEDRGIIFSGEPIVLYHSDTDDDEDEKKKEKENDVADTNKKQSSDKTIEDVVNSMTEEQKNVMYYMIGEAAKNGLKKEDETDSNNKDTDNPKKKEEENQLKHNVFEGDTSRSLAHSIDFEQMMKDGKKMGSLKEAYLEHSEALGNYLQHDDDGDGSSDDDETYRYGIDNIDYLFPDYKSLNNPPEFVQRNMDWVSKVMNGVHHTPFSRIKSVFADITDDDARALGYIKGNYKKNEVFTLLKRTTDPQTIYKKQTLDRDDIIDITIDITDFDVLAWIKAEMRMMLDEEIGRAILVGDGRLSSSDDKIQQNHVRSIYHDDDFYSVKVAVKVSKNATDDEIAKTTIRSIIKARKDYKGSGTPSFFTTPEVLTNMLLLEDANGRIIYDTEEKLRTALRVKEIVEVEVMENQTRTDSDNVTRPLIGIIANLADYNVGADKGGAVNMFDDFDIDYNQQKYLIETRISGALIKPYSALVIELEKATA